LAACGGALAVVLSQNVVRMAFWLVISLGSLAGLFFLLGAEFLGAAQLLIYVGGTVVLLIFGVMLTASGPYLTIKRARRHLMAATVGIRCWERWPTVIESIGTATSADEI
jgi:NADH:ubiquinone oxidoreductase subunit 6 (subunit J)